METKKPYNKFIKNTSNSNVLINVSLAVGFIILIICQFYFVKLTTQERVRTSNTTLDDDTTQSAIQLTAGALTLTSCSDDDLQDAIAIIKPSIVNIDAAVSSNSDDVSTQAQGGRPSFLNFDTPSEVDVLADKETLGSGVIVHQNGYILTCYHLIEGLDKLFVTIFSSERKSYEAEIVGVDEENDLVILKIDTGFTLPVARLGNSDMVQITDTVMALGAPFGFEYTVTRGIISDNKRSLVIGDKIYKDFLQTDAAINRGSAGGALISSEGEIIGLCTAIVSPTGFFAGMSFAIPINKARQLIFKATLE
jgi:serine protease Do